MTNEKAVAEKLLQVNAVTLRQNIAYLQKRKMGPTERETGR